MSARPGSVILAFSLFSVLLFSLASAQDCTSELTIIAADGINADAGTTLDIDLKVENTGTCTVETPVMAKVPEGWSATNFSITLTPGGVYFTEDKPLMVTIPAEAQTSTITIYAESAEPKNIEIIIGGSPIQNVTEETPPEPLVNVTPIIPVINPEPAPVQETVPAENKTQEEHAQPEAAEPASSVTGLLTGSPAIQSAVIVILILGGALVYQTIKGQGFRYRFKK
jgi:hypothetical protein